MNKIRKAKFRPVMLLFTQEIERLLTSDEIRDSFLRHLSGDWGNVCDESAKAYNRCLKLRLRLFSRFESETGIEYWVITEPGHKLTSMLLPLEPSLDS